MKKNTNDKSKIKKQKTGRTFKASYIGVGLVLGVFCLSFLLVTRFVNNALPSEKLYTLPTPPPLATKRPDIPVAANPPQSVLLAASPAPSTVANNQSPAIAVAAKPDTLEIILPADGQISNPFSNEALVYSQTLGDWRIHNGIDIQTEKGAEVKAAADGTILKAYEDSLMGYTIIIKHNETYQTIYQNLDSCEMVTEGQNVTQEQRIATVGNSAAAELLEESHLHFAVLAGKAYLNPEDFLHK